MGNAIAALGDVWRIGGRTPAATALIGAIAIIVWVASWLFSPLPFAGFLFAIVIYAFGIGALYAIANHAASTGHASISPAIDLITNRWLSLLGAYGILWLAGLIIGILAFIPFAILAGILLVTGADPIGVIGLAILGLIVLLVYFLYTLVLQFLYPAIAIRDRGAVDATSEAIALVRDRPISTVGFTVVRIVIQYLPFTAGGATAAVIGQDAIAEVVDEYRAVLDAPAESGAPPDTVQLFLSATDVATLVTMLGVLIVGAVVGEILRILYTTGYYRRVTADE